MNKRIFFYYESYGVGGAQLLFTRLAKYLSNQNVSIGYICDAKAFLRINLKSERNIVFVNKNDIANFNFTEADVIVTVLSYIRNLSTLNIGNKSVKIFLWDVHPYNYIEYLAFSYFYKKKVWFSLLLKLIEMHEVFKLKNNMEFLSTNNSIAFMCKKNLEFNQEFFKFEVDERFLPICLEVPHKHELEKLNQVNLSTINIAWLSRLDEDKVLLLNILIESLSALKEFEVNLFVIGDGAHIQNINYPDNLKVKLTGKLVSKELDSFLRQNVDCGFAVGTAALEFAKLAIPTFLVPGNDAIVSYNGNDSKYLLLQNITGFDVAVEKYHASEALSLQECLELVNARRNALGVAAYDYVLGNHSIKGTAKSLLNYTKLTATTLQELNRIFSENIFFTLLTRLKVFFKRVRSTN